MVFALEKGSMPEKALPISIAQKRPNCGVRSASS